jgi:predicted HicB family RNase H-like nuclease
VRVTKADKTAFKKMAKKANLSLSEWVISRLTA